MASKARRAATFLCLESLESRTLLSGTTPTVVATPAPVSASSELFVRFTTSASAAVIKADLALVGGRIETVYPDGPDLVALPVSQNSGAAIRTLEAAPGVSYAELDSTIQATSIVTPNDPLYLQQWGLGMIDAPSAWSVTTGTHATIVAVLDSGIDLSNPEFAGRIWTNPTANKDGFTGDVNGWNFINNNGNVQDNDGHGTHVSGIIAAAGNNGYGVAGVDWKTQIMPLKVLDSSGNGTTDAAISAVYFAVAHGARVINASWGGDTFSQAMLDALNYANSKGVVFVTAAGNNATNNDVTTTYPASYRTPNELVVAAVGQSGGLASFSDFGPTTVDLAAPGVGIISTVPKTTSASGFMSLDGTSMATAFVSGTVALLAGADPGLNASQLVARIRATVKPIAQLDGRLISPGVVDPYNALLNRVLLPPSPSSGTGSVTATSAPPLVPGATPFSGVETAILISDATYAAFGGNTSGYVSGVYQALDGRAPSAAELSYHAGLLNSGTETRTGLVLALQNSTEAERVRVARWYIEELGATQSVAALEQDPGVIIYAEMLASGQSVASVEATMLTNVVASAGSLATPTWTVAFLFHAVLDREAGQDGLAYYVPEVLAGATVAQVVGQFLSSPEGHYTMVANLYRDELGSTVAVATLKGDPGVAYWGSLLGAD